MSLSDIAREIRSDIKDAGASHADSGFKDPIYIERALKSMAGALELIEAELAEIRKIAASTAR